MDSGPGRKPTVTDEEILDVFTSASDPVLTTREVADELDLGRRGTLKRLKNLEEEGLLKSKKDSGRNTVWWYPGHTETTPVGPRE